MKLTIERSVFLRALGHIQGLVEKRGTIQILSNVLIDASGDDLSLTATDMGLSVVETVAADIGEKGATTVSAHTLYEIVRKLPDGCEIELYEDPAAAGRMHLKSGRSHFNLPSLPPDEFPVMSGKESTQSFTMEADDLRGLIKQTDFAMSVEETRHYLNGIYVHTTDDEGGRLLKAVATDGHRLARTHRACPSGAEEIPGVIVPRKTVNELCKILEDSQGEVAVTLSESKAIFSLDRIILTSKLVDGQFPEYERVIPKGNDKSMNVDRRVFSQAVDRVRTVSNERSRAVKFTLEKGKLTLSVSSPDSGDAVEEIEVEYTADALDIGFNSQYLLDIADQLDGDHICFDLADSSAPALIHDAQDGGALYVLMPMRV